MIDIDKRRSVGPASLSVKDLIAMVDFDKLPARIGSGSVRDNVRISGGTTAPLPTVVPSRSEAGMTKWELIAERARNLPPAKQQELLDFADFLHGRRSAARERRSVRGLGRDLDVELTAEALDEARRELWGSFPREDI